MVNKYKAKINNRIMQPLKLFIGQEKAGGIVLGISVLIALALANSGLSKGYFEFFQQQFGFTFNGTNYLYYSLHHWINDGLMAIFFFVVGLELKHEFIAGELSDVRNTILPIGAAVGGMVVPAVIYLAFNAGSTAINGWGIPMSTDIAFALGIVYLLGKRVPVAAKVFLTTLAIVDDLGAVLVIALFYTSEISFANLFIGLCFLTAMFVANKMGVKNVIVYAILGIGGVWTAFLLSGIHATIAAVLAAFVIPADSSIDEMDYLKRVRKLINRFDETEPNDVRTLEEEQVEILTRITNDSTTAIPPLQLLEHYISPIVTFVIMPIFAISNAGITITDLNLSDIFSTNVAIGVACGLLIGKPVGIVGTTLLLTKLKMASLPGTLSLRRLTGLSFLASIGFTMSIFVSTLALTTNTMLTQAKIGIFAASIIGGIAGYKLLSKE
jgi:NhaA family Na+:H+ antiporter